MRAAESDTSFSAPQGSWAERAPRTVTTLLVGKLTVNGGSEHLCRVRNLSASGMMVEAQHALGYGQWVSVELRDGQRLQGNIVWSSDGRAGVHFAMPIDVEEVLAAAKGTSPSARLHRAVPRAPRFTVDCPARLTCKGVPIHARVENISQSGACLRLSGQPDLDQVMTVTIPGLPPRACAIRWHRDDVAGIAFIDMIPYAVLAAWLGSQGVAH